MHTTVYFKVPSWFPGHKEPPPPAYPFPTSLIGIQNDTFKCATSRVQHATSKNIVLIKRYTYPYFCLFGHKFGELLKINHNLTRVKLILFLLLREIVQLTYYTITYKSRLTQKKLYKKNDAIFSIYGRNGIKPWHFFEFSLGPFEVVEAEGGRLVKEANFEAEFFFY